MTSRREPITETVIETETTDLDLEIEVPEIEYEIGDDTLAIGSVGDQWKPSPDGTSVAIEVDDFEGAIKDLKAAGAKFDTENVESPVCRMAVVQDPDGNKIIIHKLKTP